MSVHPEPEPRQCRLDELRARVSPQGIQTANCRPDSLVLRLRDAATSGPCYGEVIHSACFDSVAEACAWLRYVELPRVLEPGRVFDAAALVSLLDASIETASTTDLAALRAAWNALFAASSPTSQLLICAPLLEAVQDPSLARWLEPGAWAGAAELAELIAERRLDLDQAGHLELARSLLAASVVC